MYGLSGHVDGPNWATDLVPHDSISKDLMSTALNS